MRSQAGFTLIEVMVALSIIAIALAALSRAMGVTVSNQSALEQKTIATWVAQDRLMQVQLPNTQPLEAKSERSYMGLIWETEIKTEPTLVKDISRVTVLVTLKGEDEPSARLTTVVEPQ